MLVNLLKGKIHRATVVQTELDYVGSITIDAELLKASGICEYERVLIVNINNGKRFETYVISGKAGSGLICLNGASARMAAIGDKIIIMSFAQMNEKDRKNYKPNVVFVDKNNCISKICHYEKHGSIS